VSSKALRSDFTRSIGTSGAVRIGRPTATSPDSTSSTRRRSSFWPSSLQSGTSGRSISRLGIRARDGRDPVRPAAASRNRHRAPDDDDWAPASIVSSACRAAARSTVAPAQPFRHTLLRSRRAARPDRPPRAAAGRRHSVTIDALAPNGDAHQPPRPGDASVAAGARGGRTYHSRAGARRATADLERNPPCGRVDQNHRRDRSRSRSNRTSPRSCRNADLNERHSRTTRPSISVEVIPFPVTL